jgi:hypothetical protein
MTIKATKTELKEAIRKHIKRMMMEDQRTDRLFQLDAPQDEMDDMGIDPDDMERELDQQYSLTAEKLVDFVRQIRSLREMAAEMSKMEAEGVKEGSTGTDMWNALIDLYQDVKKVAAGWSELGGGV